VSITLEKALKEVASVFAPMVADWQELAARYTDDELRLIVGFYDEMEKIIRKHLGRLREQASAASGQPADPVPPGS
jgi:hypothetical protein